MPHLMSMKGPMYLEATPLNGIIINNHNPIPNQLWEFIPVNGLADIYQIRSISSGLLLTYHGYHGCAVTLSQLLGPNNVDYQRWQAKVKSPPFKILTLRNLKRCLDVCNGETAVGRHVIEWRVRNRGNLNNQLWNLV